MTVRHVLTRRELYDLVWSMPMMHLAARYGTSGRGLAKVCQRFDIPVLEAVCKSVEPGVFPRQWKDTAETPIEKALVEIAVEIAVMFEEVRLREQAKLEAWRQRLEDGRRRDAEALERKKEQYRLRQLVDNAQNWKTARDVRSFVASVETNAALTSLSGFDAWKSWALSVADRIDPLNSEVLFDMTVTDEQVRK